MSTPTPARPVTDLRRKTTETRYRVVIAVILFVTLLVSYLDRTNVSVLSANDTFLADMGITGDTTRIGLLLTVFLLAYGISNIVLAPLGNILGPRKAMMLSIVLWAVSMALGGLAGTFGLLLATRIILGAGEGLHWPMQSLFVMNWFPPKERGKANSAWLVGLMVGPMIAAPIITAVVIAFNWRMSFWLLVVLSGIPLLLLAFFSADTPRQSRFVGQPELDYIESELKAAHQSSDERDALTSRNAFLSDWRYWAIVLAFMCSSSVFWGTIGWLPNYLRTARDFSFADLGFLVSLPYIIGAITVLVFGAVADRFTHRGIFPTIALFGAAVCVFLGATVTSNLASAIILSLSMGFIGVGLSSYWTMMQNIVSHHAVGMAAGVMNGVAQILSAFVPTIVGAMIAATGGNYSAGLMFLVGAGALGGVLMLICTIKKV